MSEHSVEALQQQIDELRRQVARRDRILATIESIDALLEEAILNKWPVARTMSTLLPHALEHLGAHAVCVRTFNEEQHTVDFFAPDDSKFVGVDLDGVCVEIAERGELTRELDDHDALVGYRLDVTDMYLGSVVMVITETNEFAVDAALELLTRWAEQLDNYLAAISDARRKHQAMQELSDSLRVSILDHGLDRAIDVLKRYVPYTDLALALRYEEHLDASTLNFRVVTADHRHNTLSETTPALEQAVIAALAGDTSSLVARFDLQASRESTSILGADGVTTIGHVSVGLADEPLSPFSRDILDRFADYIRQRIVDFNKEWKQLSQNFSIDTVRKLLLEDNYVQRYLSPRERDVTILFCDISGFTRLSEQILKEPALIGKLIDTWGNKAVEFIWETGGVFDKMVGDCIIGLWGPPFFETTPAEQCRAALTAARKIREYTNSLTTNPELPELHGIDMQIGVATGLNHCPLFVGTFGPDENYTGFSSGMNNTARLQGVATSDEILCMESFVDAMHDADAFGEKHIASVKNVAEPLEYRKLKR